LRAVCAAASTDTHFPRPEKTMKNGKDEQACSKIPTNSIENGSVLCFILMQQQCLVDGVDDTTCVMMVMCDDGLGVSVESIQTTEGGLIFNFQTWSET
jgi:hypothetical protein